MTSTSKTTRPITNGNPTTRMSTKRRRFITSGNPTRRTSTQIKNSITSGNPTTATSTQESTADKLSRATDTVRKWCISLIVIPVLLIGVVVIWIMKRKRNR